VDRLRWVYSFYWPPLWYARTGPLPSRSGVSLRAEVGISRGVGSLPGQDNPAGSRAACGERGLRGFLSSGRCRRSPSPSASDPKASPARPPRATPAAGLSVPSPSRGTAGDAEALALPCCAGRPREAPGRQRGRGAVGESGSPAPGVCVPDPMVPKGCGAGPIGGPATTGASSSAARGR